MSASLSKIGISLGIGLAVLASTAGLAHSAETAFSGNLCRGVTQADQGKLSFGPYGVANDSGTTASVACPVSTAFNVTVTGSSPPAVSLRIYDRNSGADFYCEFDYDDGTGALTNGGSNTSASGWWTTPQIFNVPVSVAGVYGAVLYCTIPPATGNGTSYLTLYRIRTS